MTSCTPPSSFSRSSSLGMFNDSGPTPAIGLIAPPSTWYRPWNVCVRSMLMTSLTSSTTQITPRSRRGSAQIGQGPRFADVAAHLAEPHLGLDLVDRVDQVLRFLVGGRQQVEGDALRALRPDAGQFGERVDQTLDRAVIHQCHRTPRLSQTVATVVPTSAEPPSYQHNVHHHRSRHIHNTRSTPRESHTPRRYNRHTDERTRNDAARIPQPTITGDYHDTENFIDYRKRSMLRHAMSQ